MKQQKGTNSNSKETPFEEAMNKLMYASNDDNAIAATKEALAEASTTDEVIEVWDEDNFGCIEWKDFLSKALELAQDVDDVAMLFNYIESLPSNDGDMAFDKYLELCKYKEEVESLLKDVVLDWSDDPLEFDEYIEKIIQRGRELPRCPKDNY